jgi:7-alpha-hydroxysteroid dehydrogenase
MSDVILDAFKLTDRVAIVTGAGRGLGAAIAIGFAEAGADVVICARTQEQLDEVAKAVEATGRRAVTLAMNFAEQGSAEQIVAAAEKEFGRIDIVVNNVGGSMPMPFLDTTPKIFNEAFQFNVTTAFSLTQQAVPLLLRSPGASVINITSTMGRVRERGYVAYGTAKAALIHMTHLLAADLAPRIRVNAISPGSIATSALEIVSGTPELKDELESKTPLGRIGLPEEIAAAALYLASDAAAYVTGKVLDVDGGIEAANLSMKLPDLAP